MTFKIKHTFTEIPDKNYSRIVDHVICMNCNSEGLITKGRSNCPTCKKEGTLSWYDENKQEIEI